MLEIRERASAEVDAELGLALPFEARQRSRQRVLLSTGEEAALLLPRGTVLRGGDLLVLSDGRGVRVQAAPEAVSTVRASADQGRALARVAYHLGNRHVPLEVGAGFVRYLHDHVLDEMVQQLGLHAVFEQSAFEPESGAYAAGYRAHGHSHVHGHSHAHGQAVGHEHAHGHTAGHEHVHHEHEKGQGERHGHDSGQGRG